RLAALTNANAAIDANVRSVWKNSQRSRSPCQPRGSVLTREQNVGRKLNELQLHRLWPPLLVERLRTGGSNPLGLDRRASPKLIRRINSREKPRQKLQRAPASSIANPACCFARY